MSKIIVEEVEVSAPELVREQLQAATLDSASFDSIAPEQKHVTETTAKSPDVLEDASDSDIEDEHIIELGFCDHILARLVPYFYAPDLVAIGQTCVLFNCIMRPRLRQVVLPDSFDISDDSLIPVINYAESIESLRIEFYVDPNYEPREEALVKQGFAKREEDAIGRDRQRRRREVRRERKRIAHSRSRSRSRSRSPLPLPRVDASATTAGQSAEDSEMALTLFPTRAFDVNVFPQLKKVRSVHFSSCPQTESYDASAFLVQFVECAKTWSGLRKMAIPHCLNMRHAAIRQLWFNDLQLGLDGLNVHIGADLVGITHFKAQLPRLQSIVCAEMFVFVASHIWDGEHSGKENWVAMNTHARDAGVKLRFDARNSVTLMLMPREKEAPRILNKRWEELEPLFTDRLQDFFCPHYNLDFVNLTF